MILDLALILLMLVAAIAMFVINQPRMDAVALLVIVAMPFTGPDRHHRAVIFPDAVERTSVVRGSARTAQPHTIDPLGQPIDRQPQSFRLYGGALFS